MGQTFDIPLEGKFTRVTFEQLAGAESVKVGFALRDSRSSFNVGEKVFARIEVTNISEEPIHFGILGLLTDSGQFQTSWTEGNIAPGDTFRHEDGLAYDTPGRHTLQLSICFARKERCTSGQAEESWVRFQPPLEVVVA